MRLSSNSFAYGMAMYMQLGCQMPALTLLLAVPIYAI